MIKALYLTAALTGTALMAAPASLAAAQDLEPQDRLERQEPQQARPSNEEGLPGAVALGRSADEAMMGWNVIPAPIADKDPETLTELERLSRSPSGVTFGLEGYDAKTDNPLKPVAVTLRALDKITATYRDIEIPIGEKAQFGPLTLLPRTCDKRPPEETPETTVFLEVYAGDEDVTLQRVQQARAHTGEDSDQPRPQPVSSIVLPGEKPKSSDTPSGQPLFIGWMFASSPSLNAMEHPVYDVWVIDCKMTDPRT